MGAYRGTHSWTDRYVRRLQRLAANAILMARNGDYANGVTSESGVDEGEVRAADILEELDSEAHFLGLEIGCTVADNERRYQVEQW